MTYFMRTSVSFITMAIIMLKQRNNNHKTNLLTIANKIAYILKLKKVNKTLVSSLFIK